MLCITLCIVRTNSFSIAVGIVLCITFSITVDSWYMVLLSQAHSGSVNCVFVCSCILLSMEIRRLGGLITPACSYMLSYKLLCPTQSDSGFACLCIMLYSR